MKKSILSILYLVGALACMISSCAYDDFEDPNHNADGFGKINLTGSIEQEYNTRANDNGFANGDVIGVYVVDYDGHNPSPLLSKGNRGDNVSYSFNESGGQWSSAFDIYWKDQKTPIDVYGYYPFSSTVDVNRYDFTVKTDQTKGYTDGTMGDYEASDFLWCKVSGVEPTSNTIRLPFVHKMANARVTLLEGEGFAKGEWADLKKQVMVTNTIQKCEIDLATGVVTPSGNIGSNAIVPSRRDDEWRAIVIPQAMREGTMLFSITIDGIPYKFVKNEAFEYVGGKMNNFGIRVDKKVATGKYSLTLLNESITPWENDLVSHDATSKEYIVINSTPGGLKEAISAAGKDYKKLQNLKITGSIDDRDFYFMRDEMSSLNALNIKEVKIARNQYEGDAIPTSAFENKKSLTRIMLPDKLVSIGSSAFRNSGLAGSLKIPNDVEEIGDLAFADCRGLNETLTLSTSLKYIGGRAFSNCSFKSELHFPNCLEVIADEAFYFCGGIYGNLIFPDNLREIGRNCFFACSKLLGDLVIPQKIRVIKEGAFAWCNFGGTLTLHDGITDIEDGAFMCSFFSGELTLPKSLRSISSNAFAFNTFSGRLILPNDIIIINDGAFSNCYNFTGTLEFPEGVCYIGKKVFERCSGIEGLVFPESLLSIGDGAFENCFLLNSIVCKGNYPPHLASSAFNGVAKDNFTIEVPESSIVQYQTATGWNEFKRIAAHHELVCRPQVACALNKEKKQTLVLNAEGDWFVESKPDWCSLSQMSGYKKTELTLTINRFSDINGTREGDIVFRLKDKDYACSCHVTQYGYQYEEDEYLAIQTATKGALGGINIVILGDGYDAKDISSGDYLKDVKQEMEYFFNLEPYCSYRDYFNVYTAFPVSTESGVGTVNTIKYNKFNTTQVSYRGGAGFQSGSRYECDFEELSYYVSKTPTINTDNFEQTVIIVIPNCDEYSSTSHLWIEGPAVAFIPINNKFSHYDCEAAVHRDAGGLCFGKLGDENIYYNNFISSELKEYIKDFKALGWYDNLDVNDKMQLVGWRHLILDPRYSDIVDVFEGGYGYARGVYRSEENSCMRDNTPYYSTISRQSIVNRIKVFAGECFDFEEFVEKDKKALAQARILKTRSFGVSNEKSTISSGVPIVHSGSLLKFSPNKKRSSKKSIKR